MIHTVIVPRQLFYLAFIFVVIISPRLWAQGDFAPYEQKDKIEKIIKVDPKAPKKKPKLRDPGQNAIVKIDGSAVYEVANFDSPVLEYMDQGKKIQISKKIYPGIGGLGAFYKVRLRKGVFGFITDTDVTLVDKKGSGHSGLNDAKAPEEEYDSEDDPTKIQEGMFQENENQDFGSTFSLSRFFGLVYYMYNYAEKVKNRSESDKVTMFGIRKSGPSPYLGGMPVDMSLVYTSSAPDFYDEVMGKSSGFMIIADAIGIMPFYESNRYLVYYGFGLVTRYSKWSVKLRNNPSSPAVDSQEASLGVAAAAGAGVMVTEKLAFKVDAKYYYENEAYIGYGAVLQYKY